MTFRAPEQFRHPNCMHLWRPAGVELPVPPLEFV